MSYNLDEKKPAQRSDFEEGDPRPTIIRPAYRPSPLFPGWGPRL